VGLGWWFVAGERGGGGVGGGVGGGDRPTVVTVPAPSSSPQPCTPCRTGVGGGWGVGGGVRGGGGWGVGCGGVCVRGGGRLGGGGGGGAMLCLEKTLVFGNLSWCEVVLVFCHCCYISNS